MPVYEFHCPRCNLLLEFFARRATSRVPACPHCGGALSREVSSFSTGPSGGRDEAEALGGSRVDDDRAQRAVEALRRGRCASSRRRAGSPSRPT